MEACILVKEQAKWQLLKERSLHMLLAELQLRK